MPFSPTCASASSTLQAVSSRFRTKTARIWVTYNGEIYNHADVRARARSRRSPLPHTVRHGNDRPRLRAMGRRLRASIPRHVRVRALGCAAAAAAARPRPARRQAALLGAAQATRCSSRPRSRRILASGLVEARPNHDGSAGAAGDAIYLERRNALRGHLQAAARAIVSSSRTGASRWSRTWDMPLDGPDPELERLDDASSSTASALCSSESVRLRLMADVPLGVFLSGGIDSSAVAALMAREMNRPVADVLGGVRRSRFQRAGLRAPGRARHRRDEATRSSSTTTTSSVRCRGWSGTRTSRSHTHRACRCTSCRRWRGGTSRSC